MLPRQNIFSSNLRLWFLKIISLLELNWSHYDNYWRRRNRLLCSVRKLIVPDANKLNYLPTDLQLLLRLVHLLWRITHALDAISYHSWCHHAALPGSLLADRTHLTASQKGRSCVKKFFQQPSSTVFFQNNLIVRAKLSKVIMNIAV